VFAVRSKNTVKLLKASCTAFRVASSSTATTETVTKRRFFPPFSFVSFCFFLSWFWEEQGCMEENYKATAQAILKIDGISTKRLIPLIAPKGTQ